MRTPASAARAAAEHRAPAWHRDLGAFIPPLLRGRPPDGATRVERVVVGTLALVDISGFTQLTERLGARGKVGAEELTEILNSIFSELLQLARRDGASLVKWSGDAVLLLFQG